MAQAKNGDTVKVHYTGKLEDGTVFDSSLERDPLEFTVGGGMVIPGFEEAIVGMKEGESKEVTIPSGEAYGDYNEEMRIEIQKAQIPEDIQPEVGQMLQLRGEDGGATTVTVTHITDDTVTLDANHPLAGKDLMFDLKLVEISQA
ncbi:FKBP-type peptidyl-prolyl cis-trans isomerase [Desulfocurvibacter africanus]|uniref:Peptidyl-prolyl cis-trans isomerase n=1 Tax=Desulfocurvibacter africanus subsp. africanus str. Walvis Bay TaxID=690850 RepID=F3Z1F8_DESAF|nr:peptidylprolyl isomerase [Desulfocurvibacter africanus]EGJ49989.1 peptidylprolyl isomerase FKBP-type [Desulfocurvibacter africanus subsp. africanus str. Walvis Bay]